MSFIAEAPRADFNGMINYATDGIVMRKDAEVSGSHSLGSGSAIHSSFDAATPALTAGETAAGCWFGLSECRGVGSCPFGARSARVEVRRSSPVLCWLKALRDVLVKRG